MFGALWLFACGAGTGHGDSENSSLAAALEAEGDDAFDSAELASAGAERDPSASGEGVSTAHAGAPALGAGPTSGSSDCAPPAPALPGSGASGTGKPALVIGGGIRAWAAPAGGSLVWCHADVPIDCPAIEPTPDAGRLVVVQGSSDALGVPAAGTWTGGAGEESAGGEGSAHAGGIVFVDSMPATPGASAASSLPVAVGGSLPPLPGTCVAVSFGAGGGVTVHDDASGTATELAVASDQSPRPAAPSAGASGIDTAPSAGASGIGTAPSAGASGIGTAPSGTAGTAGSNGTASHGAPPLLLPPPGACLGISFPPPSSGIPGEPSSGAGPRTGSGSAPLLPPGAGNCVSIAFAAPTDPGAPATAPVPAPPLMCGVTAAPPPNAGASAEPARAHADEIR